MGTTIKLLNMLCGRTALIYFDKDNRSVNRWMQRGINASDGPDAWQHHHDHCQIGRNLVAGKIIYNRRKAIRHADFLTMFV